MLPKPNKRALTSPRSWRPIALLSCLSKGLERHVACRMAYFAIVNNITHQNQEGALPKRSATDLTAALLHDMELELAKGMYVTMATADVQGAFTSTSVWAGWVCAPSAHRGSWLQPLKWDCVTSAEMSQHERQA